MNKSGKPLKKLGVVLQYYELRDDIPETLKALSDHWEIVLFASKQDLAKVTESFEKRPIPKAKKTIKNKLWNFLFLIAGNTPLSKFNYKSWSVRRISLEPKLITRIKLRILLRLRLLLGGCIPFDKLLEKLNLNTDVKVADIDVFLAMSDVYDVNFLACIFNADKPLLFYVYSWDHIAKHHKFSHRVSKYLTWHKGISDDLEEVHNIKRSKISELGSTQLAFMNGYLNNSSENKKHPFVYYGCTYGNRFAIPQEIKLIKWLSRELTKINPNISLLIRPYPNAMLFNQYEELLNQQNIIIENLDTDGDTVSFQKDSPQEKYQKISDAALFFHSGSTIGLEASYLNTPVMFLAPDDFDYGISASSPHHLLKYFQQRHLQKYLLHSFAPNVIRKKQNLPVVLKNALENPDSFLDYNRDVSGLMNLKSIDEIALEISETAERLIDGNQDQSSNFEKPVDK